MAWDSDRDRLLWLAAAGLWSFDGAAWNPEAPTGLQAIAAAYDRQRSTLLAIDSTGLLNALPSDGGAWAALPPILTDGGVPGAVRLVWDDAAGVTIARSYDPKAASAAGMPQLGCPTYVAAFNHAWDGTQWLALNTPPTTDLVPPCGDIAFDPRQRTVVQGVFVPGAGLQADARNAAGNWVAPTSIPIFPPLPSAAGLLFQSSPGLMARWLGHDAANFPLTGSRVDYFNGAAWQPAGGVPGNLPGAWNVSVVNLGVNLNVLGGGNANTGPPCQEGGNCGCSTACNGEGCSCSNPLWSDDEQHELYFLQGGLATAHISYFPFEPLPRHVRAGAQAADRGQQRRVAVHRPGSRWRFRQYGQWQRAAGGSVELCVRHARVPARCLQRRLDAHAREHRHRLGGSESGPVPQPLFDVNADPVSGHAIAVTTDGRACSEWSGAEGLGDGSGPS